MTRRKKATVTAFFYALNIIIFAIVYWIFWALNANNFIVNSEYNAQTVQPFFFYGDLPDSNMTSEKLLTATEANELIKPYYDTLQLLNKTRREIETKLVEYKILDSLNCVKLSASFKMNSDKYLAKHLEPYEKIRKAFLNQIDSIKQLQTKAPKNNSDYFRYDADIARTNLKIANLDVALSEVRYNLLDTIVKRIPAFYDDTLSTIANMLYTRIDTLEKKKEQLFERILQTKEAIRLIAVDYYMNKVFRLGFFDFLYFSIITASSTGYGDILPNSLTIRNLVSAEIILSLFLFGFFFYFIADTQNKKGSS